ncbi:MAG: Hsp70 family protein [Thermodesulfobacteriota bacterium]|nr:Hsp70 family protein [Thermodesulfobacteriota bacterium]
MARLVRDAGLHADEDRNKKELVDARNTADALIYTTEKSTRELGDKIDSATIAEVEGALNDLKQVIESEDTAQIKRLTEMLTQASHKIAASMYNRPPLPERIMVKTQLRAHRIRRLSDQIIMWLALITRKSRNT